MAVTITLTEEQLKELYRYEQYLSDQNENEMPFEFWHVVGLMDAVVEVYEAAHKQVGWMPPTPEDLGLEEEEDDGPDTDGSSIIE